MSDFYCDVKGCRKTAWDTPEHMSSDDWDFLKEITELMSGNHVRPAFDLLWKTGNEGLVEAFFNRVLGWPEGYGYCHSEEFWEKTAFPGIVKHSMVKMKKALKDKD